jgi:hypothetical protein
MPRPVKRPVLMGPTHKTTWKRFERVVALFFGAKRVPLSGSNSGHGTNSDSLHPLIYVESKYRKGAFGIYDLFRDTEQKALHENKIPVVAIKQKGDMGYLLVLRPEDLHLLDEIKKLSSQAESLDDYFIELTKSTNGRSITKQVRRKSNKG